MSCCKICLELDIIRLEDISSLSLNSSANYVSLHRIDLYTNAVGGVVIELVLLMMVNQTLQLQSSAVVVICRLSVVCYASVLCQND